MARERVHIDVESLVKSYANGMSIKQLAEELGTSRRTITKRLRQAGTDIRGIGEANILVWERRTPKERARQMTAAHKAVRGKPRPPKTNVLFAKNRAQRLTHIGNDEPLLCYWLTQRELSVIPQRQEGPYNIDLAVNGAIAVEVFRENGHPFHRTDLRKRTLYLINSGWHVLYIWISHSHVLTESAADFIAAFAADIRATSPTEAQYRVIRGTGEIAVRRNGKPYDVPLVPTSDLPHTLRD